MMRLTPDVSGFPRLSLRPLLPYDAVVDDVIAPPDADRGRRRAMTRRTVLYIEDNEMNVRLVARLLEQRPDVRLVTASRGQEGIDLAREQQPDLILLDLHLPDMEGTEVLRAIRQDPTLAQTPVIVLSAETEPDVPAEVRAAGAQGYLLKPLDFTEFFAAIDGALSAGGE